MKYFKVVNNEQTCSAVIFCLWFLENNRIGKGNTREIWEKWRCDNFIVLFLIKLVKNIFLRFPPVSANVLWFKKNI